MTNEILMNLIVLMNKYADITISIETETSKYELNYINNENGKYCFWSHKEQKQVFIKQHIMHTAPVDYAGACKSYRFEIWEHEIKRAN